jgi:outer membrane protein
MSASRIVAGGLWASVMIPSFAMAQSLEESLVSTYLTNPQLEADRARQRAADEDVSRAWSGWRPQVTASGSVGISNINVLVPNSTYNPFGPTAYNDGVFPNSTALQLKQEIWDGNRTLADVRHSSWSVANGRAVLQSTEQSVLGTAVQAYYDLYRDQQVVAIQKEYVRALEDERKAARARFAVKDVTQTDVAQAEARLARGVADLRQDEGSVENSRSAFAYVVGIDPGNLVPPPPIPKILPQSLDEALALTDDNPDLRASVFVEKAADTDVQSAESGLLPDLSLTASSIRTARQDYTLSVTRERQVALVLTVPLYDGGSASARTREAKHILGQRRISVDLQRLKTIDQIKRSWENLQATHARIVALEENVHLALVALDGVKQELRVGSRTVIEELNARQEYYDAEIQLLRSQHDETISAYTLLLACGRLTAESLKLPVALYDPKENYAASSWQPWGPWIDQDYPTGSPTKDEDYPSHFSLDPTDWF